MAGAEFATEASGDAESSRCDRGRQPEKLEEALEKAREDIKSQLSK